MTDTLDLDPQTKLDTAGKRALIEQELRIDPNRSDREIARVVGHGVDHKTVGAARERMGIASPLGNSPLPATERRRMLIAAGEDFIANNPDLDDGKTSEEAVDDAIASGKISLVPQSEDDEFGACYVIPHQARIECSLTTDGQVEISQEGHLGPEEGDRVHVALGNAVALARCILYAAGFRNVCISTFVRGGYEDVEDGDTANLFDYTAPPKPGYGVVR